MARGLVFMNPNTRLPINDHKAPRLVWNRALASLNIEHRDAYATRDTYCSISLSAGMTPIKVVQQSGHSLAMLYKHYGRWIKTDDGSTDAFDNAVGQTVGQTKRPIRGIDGKNQ